MIFYPTELTPAQKKQKNSRRFFGVFLVLITVGFLIYEVVDNPEDIFSLFNKSNKILVLLLVLLQSVSFLINAVISNRLLSQVNERADFKDNLKISFMNEFGNRLLPIFGGSVTSFLGYRRLNIPSAAIVFMESMWTALNLIQYILFFLISILLIPHSFISLIPKLSYLTILIVAGIGILLWYTFLHKKSKNVLKRMLLWAVKIIGYIFPISFNEKDVDTKIEEGWKKLFLNFSQFFKNKKNAIAIFLLGSVYFFIDILMFYVAFLTFEYLVPLELVIFGMILSLFLSILTLFPGQPGVTEALFVLTFNALGVPLNIAILASILYRLTSYWLWLPASTYFVFWGKKKLRG